MCNYLRLLPILTIARLTSVFIACNEENFDIDPANITEANYFPEEGDFERGASASTPN